MMPGLSIHRTGLLLALGLIGAAVSPASADAQGLPEVGRELAEKFGPAIITVQILVTIGDDSSGDEQKVEAIGTVVGPDGLTLVPLSAIDPTSMFRGMGPQAMFFTMNMQSRVKDIKFLLGRRKEVPATVVLRDPDLHFAFLRPLEKPAEPMTYIDLTQAVGAEMLDPIVTLSRMGKAGQRKVSLATGEIRSIVEKPRMFYVPQLSLNGLGVPVFNGQGELIGISLLKTSPGGMEDMMGGAMTLNATQLLGGMLPIILPAEDVHEAALQAPEEAPEEALEEEAADDVGESSEPAPEEPAGETGP